jgi:hypothetical protein
VFIGLGSPDQIITSKNVLFYGGSYPYPNNNIVIDVSEFKNAVPVLLNQPIFLRVKDTGTTRGTITYFAINDVEATDVPIQTVANSYVYSTVVYSQIHPTLSVTPSTGSPSAQVTLTGIDFPPGSTVTFSYLNPLTSTWTTIGSTAAPNGNFTFNTKAPDLMQNSAPGDHQADSANIIFRAQENIRGQYFNCSYKEMARGLSRIGNLTATGLYGNNSDFSSAICLKSGQSLTVAGKWFSPGTATVLLDGLKIGEAAVDNAGLFTTEAVFPSVVGGKHTVTIQNAGTAFSVVISALPSITNDYVDAWHTANFNVNLSSDLPLKQIYYKINGGPVYSVSANGMPLISLESGDNTLEYWGIWDVYGTGNIELQHYTLTGIKLDKTPPTAHITSGNSTETPTVTLSLAASDKTSGISQMRFSNDNITWSAWEPYGTSKTWNLQGQDGQKTVYAQFSDRARLISQCNKTIVLQSAVPTPTPTSTADPTSPPAPTSSATPGPSSTSEPSATSAPTTQATPLATQRTPTTNPTAPPTESPNPTLTPKVPELSAVAVLFLMAASLAACLIIKRRNHEAITA